MNPFGVLIGLAFLALGLFHAFVAGYAWHTGFAGTNLRRYRRTKEPIKFWSIVLLAVFLAVLFSYAGFLTLRREVQGF